MPSIRQDLGAVSSWAIAREHGYTGTEEEWAQLQANSGNNAQAAQEARTGAEAAARKTDEAVQETGRQIDRINTKQAEVNASLEALGQAITGAGNAERSLGTATETAYAAAGNAGTKATEAREAAAAAGKAKTDLDGSIKTAGETKAALDASNEAATKTNQDLDKLVQDAGTTSAELTQGVQDAEKAIAGLDKQTGKVVYYVDLLYRTHVVNAKTSAEVDALFAEWWHINWHEGKSTKQELLDRWFGSVLDDGLVHGVKLPLFSTSSSPSGELTDDSVGLVCEPSTASAAGRDDFARLPQFWAVEVAAEKRPDGSHEIYAVEHIDPIDQVRSGEHLCWVLQKNTYTKEWQDATHHYFQMQCHAAPGFEQWPQGTDRQGRTYAYIANPKYAAGEGPGGVVTCGTGLRPVQWTSHSTGVPKWRARGSQYAGASGCLIKWQLAMIWLKYGKKGNSGTIEGCTYYWWQYRAAVSEKGVQRILLTPSEAGNVIVGSTISIGSMVDNQTDRYYPDTRDLADRVTVLSIDSVTVGNVEYKAIMVDNDGKTFDTEAGVTIVSSMPYRSGYNDQVLGYDGSRTSPTGSKEPGLIQKTEFQNGAYLILADEFWKWGTNADGDFTFDVYTCHDQTKISPSAITEAYTKQEDLTLIFPKETKAGWWYNEDCMVGKDRGVLWTKPSQAAGSGTGLKSGFYMSPASDGLRAAWVFCFMHNGSRAGLPARFSSYGSGCSLWLGCLGAPGLCG